MTTDRDIALDMARTGVATLAEIADLAQTSRQLVAYWCRVASVDFAKARADYLTAEWNRRVQA
jgi:predicted NUDIX family NTP pyrophosphohydrolase